MSVTTFQNIDGSFNICPDLLKLLNVTNEQISEAAAELSIEDNIAVYLFIIKHFKIRNEPSERFAFEELVNHVQNLIQDHKVLTKCEKYVEEICCDNNVPKETEESLDKKIHSLSNIKEATSVSDIKVKSDDPEIIQGIINHIDNNNTPLQEESLPQTDDQLREVLLKKIRELDPDKRDKIMADLANLQQVNPNNKSFSSIGDNKRQMLLRKLHEKRGQLALRRKPKRVLQGMQNEFEKQCEEMRAQFETANNSNVPNDTNVPKEIN